MNERRTFEQENAYASPWSRREQIGMLLWEWTWRLLCEWTPKPLNGWRLFWLRTFGAKLEGCPFVHQRARIQIPWNLALGDRACLGDRANVYSLGRITVGARATVAQEVYLCAGTHDFTRGALPLQTAPIHVGEDAFIGVRALVLPGVTIGARAVIGGGSVVTRDVPAGMVAAGNPAHVLRPRA